jgi:hypothetical protein
MPWNSQKKDAKEHVRMLLPMWNGGMLLQAEEDALYWLPEKDCSADGRGVFSLYLLDVGL